VQYGFANEAGAANIGISFAQENEAFYTINYVGRIVGRR
jgi:hypothetical protein